jgi:parvulin-like peptidyl-prolyl isomerase
VTRTSCRLALAGLVVLLLSACGDGQVRPGAAAVVGEQRISAEQLQQLVDRSLADPQVLSALGIDRETFQRQVLGRLIGGELLQVAADRNGVEATEGELDVALGEFEQEAGGAETFREQVRTAGVAPEDLRGVLRDIVLQRELVEALTRDLPVPADQLQAAYTSNITKYDQVRARHILVADEALAQSTLAQVRAEPGRFAELAAQLSIDEGSKASGGDLPPGGRGTYVPEFEQVLFSAPPGSVELARTQFGFHVIQVQERRTTSLAQATPELRASLLEDQGTTLVDDLLKSTAAEVGVTVNPRFGVWDAALGQVRANEAAGLISPAPVPGQGPAQPQDPAQPQEPAQPQPPAPSR